MDSDITDLLAASWVNFDSNDDTNYLIHVFLLIFQLGRFFRKLISLITDLPAYCMCNTFRASLPNWHSWIARSRLSSKLKTMISIACSSIFFPTMFSSSDMTNPQLRSSAFICKLLRTSSSSFTPLNLSNLASYLFSSKLYLVLVVFPSQRCYHLKFNVNILIPVLNSPFEFSNYDNSLSLFLESPLPFHDGFSSFRSIIYLLLSLSRNASSFLHSN